MFGLLTIQALAERKSDAMMDLASVLMIGPPGVVDLASVLVFGVPSLLLDWAIVTIRRRLWCR